MTKIVRMNDRAVQIADLWFNGLKRGSSTGWPSIDEHYTVVPGQVTVITGWPGSGKSEWLDAMLVSLARKHWRVVYYSPENHPVALHMSKLLEKWVGRPFGPGPTERMDVSDAMKTQQEVSNRFGFIEPGPDEVLTVRDILEYAQDFYDDYGMDKIARGLVIDPWNEVEHGRPANLTETEYISLTLGMVRRWARQNNVHVWIVAHPAKQKREDGKLPVARPDMIAGSQHWWNKADNCISIFRDYAREDGMIEVHVQKIRFKHIGRIGRIEMRYDKPTGRYFDIPKNFDAQGREIEYSYGS